MAGYELWRGLLSEDPLWINDPKEPERTKHFIAAWEKPEADRTQDEFELVEMSLKITWESVRNPEGKSAWNLLTEDLLQEVDAHAAKVFELLGGSASTGKLETVMVGYWNGIESMIK